jgi:hypothetical protein
MHKKLQLLQLPFDGMQRPSMRKLVWTVTVLAVLCLEDIVAKVEDLAHLST